MRRIDLSRQMDFLTKLFSDYRPEDAAPQVIDLDTVPSPQPATSAGTFPEAPAAECEAAADTSAAAMVASTDSASVSSVTTASVSSVPLENEPQSAEAPAPELVAEPTEIETALEEEELLQAVEPEVELSPLARFLTELAERDDIEYPPAAWPEQALCASKRTALTILVRRDSTVENIEWGVVSLLADQEGARAVKETRSYDLWRGRYYDILVAKLIFEDRTETRQYFFDASRSMFR